MRLCILCLHLLVHPVQKGLSRRRFGREARFAAVPCFFGDEVAIVTDSYARVAVPDPGDLTMILRGVDPVLFFCSMSVRRSRARPIDIWSVLGSSVVWVWWVCDDACAACASSSGEPPCYVGQRSILLSAWTLTQSNETSPGSKCGLGRIVCQRGRAPAATTELTLLHATWWP